MIKAIKLTNFRNFKNKTLKFSPKVTVIVGQNATGKTNILETMFLLATAKGFRARVEAELIKHNENIATVQGLVNGTKLEVKITTGENGWPKKKLLVNGVSRRMIDFSENFKAVLFGPWDMDLVAGRPSLRRKFLDTVLSQTDREYRRSSLSYEKGLRQRNRLLFRIREEGLNRSQLLFWNQLIIKNGNYITQAREKFIEFVNSTDSYKLEYDRSVVSEGRLEQYKEEEIAAATTLVGPHRDDFIFQISNLKSQISNLSAYGSRGEQRMGVLWLKMAELSYINEETGDNPTLLLDDIFSELDKDHRITVMEMVKKQQTIITTADEHFLKGLKTDSIIKI